MTDLAGDPGVTAGAVSEAERSRRPTSLRDESGALGADGPGRPTESSAGPGATTVTPPVSEPAQAGISGQVPHVASRLGTFSPNRIPMDKLPNINVVVDQEAIGQLKALIARRPEVGLGLAFAGGLVLATIVKRLGRK